MNEALKKIEVLGAGTSILIQAVQDLSKAHDLERVMAIVRRSARLVAESDGATFVLKDGEFCHYADEDAIGPLWKGRRFPLRACISGWSMLHREIAVIEDIRLDPRIPQEAYRSTFVRSLVMIPIRRSDPLGAIGVYWAKVHRPSEKQLVLLEALVDSVSVAMENVELHAALEKRIDELREANRAKDEFLVNVTHELRTPLTSILGWSELLLEGQVAKDELPDAFQSIHRNARGQQKIVDDLLDTSRIMLGSMVLDPRPLDLTGPVEAVINALRTTAARKGVDVNLHRDAALGLVRGDADRMQQLMMKLLDNAIKFSNPGGEVDVALARRGPSCEIIVRDHGAGIDKEFLPKLFDSFLQSDTSLTRKFGGLGLGLSIARALVEAQDGQITGTSEGPGQGATFTVTFPVLQEQLREVPGGMSLSC
ncbi:MAG: GAF domain-containing sensor histidine kinase [Bdellovibrionaceae bacterium]|nr:GAF domain-containing sensor histidine kinase [Pseudobdellovibrionaceae bacterium]